MTQHIYPASPSRVRKMLVAAGCLVALAVPNHAVHAQEVLLRIGSPGIEGIQLTKSGLAELPGRQIRVSEQDGSQSDYRCVLVSELLRTAKVPRGRELRSEWLRRRLTVRAADGYETVFSLPELDPEHTEATAALCYAKDGRDLPGGEGQLRLVVPGEKRHSRWVRQVVELRVTD